jgi:hypothetical protein
MEQCVEGKFCVIIFYVFTVVTMNFTVFCVVLSCGLVLPSSKTKDLRYSGWVCRLF